MDNDKPFKTIEVIDSRTTQVCKVACMSCIRGHRTTSCGIPVCRTKVFWTVKRPGRPSNSCTCRYGATGGCKCVVARAACPHKSKKGEKRSGECRCDEFGRYCCLLDPEHWTSLLLLQKPTVDFFPTREALEEKQAAANQITLPPTPARLSIMNPPTNSGLPSTPASHAQLPPISVVANPHNGFQQPMSSTLTPRFGMMGIGAPMGSQHNHGADVLVWQGQAPAAPRAYHPLIEANEPGRGSCCQAATPPSQSVRSPGPSTQQPYTQNHDTSHPQPVNGIPTTVSMSQLSPAPFDLEKLRIEYIQHQLPNSICQNCGLSGCTCRNCPPVFQNFGTTSWAQCCGRKHARDMQTTPVPQKVPRTEKYDPAEGMRSQPPPGQEPLLHQAFHEPNPFPVSGSHFHNEFQDMTLPPPSEATDFPDFDLVPDFGHHLTSLDGTDSLDLSAFLVPDLDRSIHHEITKHSPVAEQANTEQAASNGEGCCCSR